MQNATLKLSLAPCKVEPILLYPLLFCLQHVCVVVLRLKHIYIILSRNENRYASSYSMDKHLHTAAYNGDLGEVERILKVFSQFLPLFLAVIYIHYVQLSTNTRFAPIHTAALNGHVEVLEKLVQNGTDVRGVVRGCPPTYYAATAGKWDAVFKLVELGADVNSKASSGMTILHIAAKSGTEDVVRKLVRLGANPIAQMEYITPLHSAASDGSVAMVRFLYLTGAGPKLCKNKENSVFYALVAAKKIENAKELIRLGATVGMIPKRSGPNFGLSPEMSDCLQSLRSPMPLKLQCILFINTHNELFDQHKLQLLQREVEDLLYYI